MLVPMHELVVLHLSYLIIFVICHAPHTPFFIRPLLRYPQVCVFLLLILSNTINSLMAIEILVAAITSNVEPGTYKEVVREKRWRKSMHHEIDALEKNHTWDIIDLPPGKKPIGCK